MSVALEAIEYSFSIDSPSSATVIAQVGTRLIASLNLYCIEEDPFIDGVYVEAGFRRRGIATSLWQLARQHCPDLRHSSECTPVGHAWAKAVGGYLPKVTLVDPRRYRYDVVAVDEVAMS